MRTHALFNISHILYDFLTMRRQEKSAAKSYPYQLLPTNSAWLTVSKGKELKWPNRSAHTRAGHVDHIDDLRTLAPYVAKLEPRFLTINDVLDKAEEAHGFVCRKGDKMDVFLRELERTKDQLPLDLLEYLQSFLEYMDLLYYYHCLKYTISGWRKQERRLKALKRLRLAWIARCCRSLQGSCIIRCTCKLPHEQPVAIRNPTPTVQGAGQEASGQEASGQAGSEQQARTKSSMDILTSEAAAEKPPPLLICPITLLLEDPVVAADGFTYSRSAIERWLRDGRSTSPMTNQRLAHKHLTPNNTIRSMLLDWSTTKKPGFP
ncbi:probable U-box domain-containing protein 36 at C-terminar half [Coccomyxa sp. Obi]|nr:probable U-box domain-containing protein 36 at C-terminar half [Coccomyxa sp. Obi]